MAELLIFLLAKTEKDGWKAIGKYEDRIPDLTDARIVTTHGGKWADGARVQRLYVAPGAEEGPQYRRCMLTLRRSLIRTPGADDEVRLIQSSGGESWLSDPVIPRP